MLLRLGVGEELVFPDSAVPCAGDALELVALERGMDVSLGHALGEGLVELIDIIAVVVVAVVLRTCPLAGKQEVGVRYADAVRIGVELTDETHDLLLVDFYVEHGVAHLSVGESAGEAERKTVFAGDAEHELKQLEAACLDAVERAHVVVKVRGSETKSLEAVYLSVDLSSNFFYIGVLLNVDAFGMHEAELIAQAVGVARADGRPTVCSPLAREGQMHADGELRILLCELACLICPRAGSHDSRRGDRAGLEQIHNGEVCRSAHSEIVCVDNEILIH